jgi:uncharacterized protein YacL
MEILYLLIFLAVFIYALVVTFLYARKSKPNIIRNEEIVVVDTSVLIDGRIDDIAKTGFVSGVLLVLKPVLDELQGISDSKNHVRRQKGRRGIEILKKLQKNPLFEVKIMPDQYPDIEEVDDKLVRLASDKNAKILTVDYNLNRIAEIQGVHTLNVNELANATKPSVIPGEKVKVKVVQRGKEKGQGVGYLDDGTMIVVEEGLKFKGQEISVEVSRILQTDAGLMIFAKPKK